MFLSTLKMPNHGRRNGSKKLGVYVDQRTSDMEPLSAEERMRVCGFPKSAYDLLTSTRPPKGYRDKPVERRPDGVWVLKDYL
ncbi:MAG: hypothetical protein V3V26_02635 [Candidatus Aenigmarchaeota archaeon]